MAGKALLRRLAAALKGDLAQMIMNACTDTGYIHTEDGVRIASGECGCEGFLRWLCLHYPKSMVGVREHLGELFD
jgi:hypothetical protein